MISVGPVPDRQRTEQYMKVEILNQWHIPTFSIADIYLLLTAGHLRIFCVSLLNSFFPSNIMLCCAV
jgi:hypothetical protein